MTLMNYSEAINDAFFISMKKDKDVICYGLGVTDPKGVFGTTLNLEKSFGKDRVFDIPTSENAMTGIGIGACVFGLKVVMTHQRLDFALLSMDQLVNNAAKWRFMFGNKSSVSLTIRMIIGRGWGQGPTHSQSLQSIFAHIPGLKVVMPSSPSDAKGLLISSIFDPDPTIFLEHRWLHGLRGKVPKSDYRVSIGKGKIIKNGKDITIVAMSYMVIEAIHAVNFLEKQNVKCELIDLRTISPIDWGIIKKSVKKTGKLLILDTGHLTGSISSEISAWVTTQCWNDLTHPPVRLAAPDFPEATSFSLTKDYHVKAEEIIKKIGKILNLKFNHILIRKNMTHPHDVPGEWFKGPF